MSCDKKNCIANCDGECAAEKCRGEINIISDISKLSSEARSKLYNTSADIFRNEFEEKGIDENETR